MIGARRENIARMLDGHLSLLAGIFFGICLNATAQTKTNALQSIDIDALPGGNIIVRVDLKEALAAIPAGLIVENPIAIAIDLPGVSNGLQKNRIDGKGGVRSVVVAEGSGRSLMWLSLHRPLRHTMALEGASLVITLEPDLQTTGKAAETTKFSPSPSAWGFKRRSLTDVDFRRGLHGEGRLVVDLSSPDIGIDIRRQGKNVIVEFADTTTPRSLIQHMDVVDFKTPVQHVDVSRDGANTRMLIESIGLWEYSAYQTDNRFVIEIKELRETPSPPIPSPGTTGYIGERVSLDFKNVDVRTALQVIASLSGLAIITSDTVSGSLTLRLKEVPWDQALDIILQARGLAKRKNGHVVLVARSDELIEKKHHPRGDDWPIVSLEALRTESFQLSYAKAADIVKKLMSEKVLTTRGSATSDERINTIYVNDTSSRLDEVRRLIAHLDVPIKTIMIESQLVIADKKWAQRLAAEFKAAMPPSHRPSDLHMTKSIDNARGQRADVRPLDTGAWIGAEPPAEGATDSLRAFAFGNAYRKTIELELSVLEAADCEENRCGKILASPRIFASDNKKTTILQDLVSPYATRQGVNGNGIIPANLGFEATPQIMPDGKIAMALEIKFDFPERLLEGTTSSGPRILRTSVVVDNGETAMLGGIPWSGGLLSRASMPQGRMELLIFIRPRIVRIIGDSVVDAHAW